MSETTPISDKPAGVIAGVIQYKNFQKLQADIHPHLRKCQKCNSFAFLRQGFRAGNDAGMNAPINVYVNCSKCNYRTSSSLNITFPNVKVQKIADLIAGWNADWNLDQKPEPEPEPKPAEEPAPVKRKPGRPRKSASTDGQPSN